METRCINRVYSEDYQDYIVEYTGLPDFLESQYGDDCFQLVSYRFAVAYHYGREVQSGINSGVYIVPHCYGLMSSEQVLESAGIAKVQRQPVLQLYGNGIMVGFIDTGSGV
ncbi:MAG TPA: hypothetical protein DCZ23_08265 [Lachnospiraceae bacterium]|nr:hypothetical protein [Lachnospiraceae bacterium]